MLLLLLLLRQKLNSQFTRPVLFTSSAQQWNLSQISLLLFKKVKVLYLVFKCCPRNTQILGINRFVIYNTIFFIFFIALRFENGALLFQTGAVWSLNRYSNKKHSQNGLNIIRNKKYYRIVV